MASLTLKRAGGSLDADFIVKKIKLEVSSSGSSSSEPETIYSFQGYETASPHDTSDTSNSDVEYEVQSLTDVTLSEISSGPEDCGMVQAAIPFEDFSDFSDFYVGDTSESPQTSDDEDRTNHAAFMCTKCKMPCKYPFRLCVECYRQKKIYLPPRPRGRRKKHLGSSPKTGSSFDTASFSQSSTVSSQETSSQEKANVCKCCFANPIDGVFIHKNSVHPMYCYQCSVKQWRSRGRCPFCNQKLCKVAKIFPVED